jgi:hypothetical protein
MTGDITKAKRLLPLPALLYRLGLGEHAKKSARCPFHDDNHNSFSVWKNAAGLWSWNCFTGCGGGDEITFLEKHEGLSNGQAIKRYLELASVSCAAPPTLEPNSEATALKPNDTKLGNRFEWQRCVDVFDNESIEWLAKWRGLSIELCCWLKENALIGMYAGCIAFPVHDESERVIAVHYRQKDGSWRYYPQGIKVRPLIIGELVSGDPVHIFESYFDGFGFMDVSGERTGIMITRGAGNGALASGLIQSDAPVYAWKQNDELKNGKRAGDEWLKDVVSHAGTKVFSPSIPAQFKDLNDWTRAGATPDDLLGAILKAKSVPEHGRLWTGDNSLNSQFLPQCDDYPEPLGPEAFYGLTGKIVMLIEAHTEADRVALLFQLLAAFGSMIGHDHYIVADGSPHHLNVYGVLVGESSKGRKGTSWNHVANLMERVDPEWRQERITYGLSSGEGLIWAVRDPIEETRPIREKGRHTGEYETYIANHGEDDKRLFVIESEFANVLKVMAREGNTLSPVIRCAWDSGDLNTMTKNSPVKATKAHISIIGHITRDELRRLLTQTESANGFANRFCWLAVKRSKCLPDGGAIHTVKFDDVIADLQSAVDFARDFVEIARDPEAKKLWRDVYPRLSEAQPGMSGAVVARAEAQVMRLSAVYALLDKSSLIRPEHHQAAMAVWRYCEQSAKWVFGTNTGDRNADKILAALRHAPNGMTKTEISGEVFNRHAPSAAIDEALRLLYGLKMVNYKIESTAGAPTQRWFVTAETAK